MATTFDLPSHVITILRYMQQCKDALQWNFEVTSQRVVLRLKWTLNQVHVHSSSSTDRRHSHAQRRDAIQKLLERLPVANQRCSWRRRMARHCANVRRALTRHEDDDTSLAMLRSTCAVDSPASRAWRQERERNHSENVEHAVQPRSTATAAHPTSAGGSTRHSHVTDVTQSALPLPFWQRCQSLGTLTSGKSDAVTSASRSRPQITYRSQSSLQESLEAMFKHWQDLTQQQLCRIKQQWDDDVTRWPYSTLVDTQQHRRQSERTTNIRSRPNFPPNRCCCPQSSDDEVASLRHCCEPCFDLFQNHTLLRHRAS